MRAVITPKLRILADAYATICMMSSPFNWPEVSKVKIRHGLKM
jgi:hypothetical protein